MIEKTNRVPLAFITGWGAVSPAGWSAGALREALAADAQLPIITEKRSENAPHRHMRKVPPLAPMPDWMKNARLRRTTTAARYAVHAALEALGEKNRALVQSGALRLGIVFCTMNGCVQFSRRFFEEVLTNPAFASPILFPETVYNAPASHLSALLGSPEMNYTLIGDSAQFVRGVELGAQWIEDSLVDACLVVSAEELDWVSDEAWMLFGKNNIATEGAAAVLLQRESQPDQAAATVQHFTPVWTYGNRMSRAKAARELALDLLGHARKQATCFDGFGSSVCGVFAGLREWHAEYISVCKTFGEGFSVTSGWQTVAACEWLMEGRAEQAVVSAVGLTQQAAGLVVGGVPYPVTQD